MSKTGTASFVCVQYMFIKGKNKSSLGAVDAAKINDKRLKKEIMSANSLTTQRREGDMKGERKRERQRKTERGEKVRDREKETLVFIVLQVKNLT